MSDEVDRFVAENIPQQVWTATPDGALDYVNSVVTRYFDQSAQAILGVGWKAFIHPDDLSTCLERWGRSLTTGENYEIEFRLRRHDGVYRWHLGRAIPMRDSDGRLARWFGTCTDIDDHKRLQAELQLHQETLRRTEERFRQLFLQAPAAICLLTGPEHLYELANPPYMRLVGNREIIGRPLLEALPELASQGIPELLDQVSRTGQTFVGQAMRIALDQRGDGQLEDRYFDFVYEPMRDIGGLVAGVMVVATDVTDQVLARQRVEAARQRAELSEQRFQLITEVIPQLVWSMRPDGSDTYLSPRWYEYTGQPIDLPVADKWRQALHPDDHDRCFTQWAAAQKAGAMWQMEYRLRRADGVYRWHLGRSAPHRDRDGTIVRWYGAATDIDEQRNAIRSRDDLLATVSHDLRNPLGAIILATALLLRTPQDSPAATKVVRHAASIERAALRMEQLIRDLLDIASIESGHLSVELKPESTSELVAEAVEAIRSLVSVKSLHLIAEPPAKSQFVRCDRSRVLQVFSNLLGNAIKFTPQAGSIAVSVRPGPGFVTFVVADTGVGIDRGLLPFVFDRFWQAKETARAGSGLGLAICKGIIEQHGGKIWVESEPGGGATFFFTLPECERVESAR